MKLYYVPRTRSSRPRWTLEEIGLPYELVRLDPKAGDNKKPEYLKVNPLGHVPSFEDAGMHMFESAAICAYLADKFPEKKLCPPSGSIERGPYYQWMFFGMATLEPPILHYGEHTRVLPEEKRVKHIAEDAEKRFHDVAKVVQDALTGKEYLLGNFSVADIVIGGSIVWARSLKLLEKYPGLLSYADRLTARPAFKKATAD